MSLYERCHSIADRGCEFESQYNLITSAGRFAFSPLNSLDRTSPSNSLIRIFTVSLCRLLHIKKVYNVRKRVSQWVSINYTYGSFHSFVPAWPRLPAYSRR